MPPVARRKPSASPHRIVIVTGLSGSGKATVLKALEDLGYFPVDNLPLDLIPKLAELTYDSPKIRSAALGVDIREGDALSRFPDLYRGLAGTAETTLVFLEADTDVLTRRYSETRRPHPLGTDLSLAASIEQERQQMEPIRALADLIVDTSKLNVHELRDLINERFRDGGDPRSLAISVNSFGFRSGVPADSDLVFDVRFLPNPNYIPEFKPLTGRHPRVARYIRSFPQTVEFLDRVTGLLAYLIPHYIKEGKAYLTISIGCTGGQHRSVMIAGEIRKRLAKHGYRVKESHRDMPR